MVQLRVCEQCERHVRIGEGLCPFCQAALAPQPLDLRRKAVGSLSRAQRFAAAMAMAASPLAGCVDDVVLVPSQVDSGGQAETGGSSSGGSLTTGGAQATGGLSTTGGEMAAPVYGAPFPTGGTDTDASAPDASTDAAVDAGEDAGPIAIPVYGLAPNPSK